jgi:RNA polymerase sigma factor (sigma-70 family)
MNRLQYKMGIFDRGIGDRRVMELLRSGHSRRVNRALDSLYAVQGKAIVAQLLREGCDPADAADALQHAMAAFWKFAMNPENEIKSSIQAWLHVAARHQWLNQLERRKRLDSVAEEIKFQFLHPHDGADGSRIQEILDRILGELDTRCRQILEWRFLDGRDRSHIATELNYTNVESVSNKINRCLKLALQCGHDFGYFHP